MCVELVRMLRLTPTGALFAGRVAGAPVATRTVALTRITWPATPAARIAYRAAFLLPRKIGLLAMLMTDVLPSLQVL